MENAQKYPITHLPQSLPQPFGFFNAPQVGHTWISLSHVNTFEVASGFRFLRFQFAVKLNLIRFTQLD